MSGVRPDRDSGSEERWIGLSSSKAPSRAPLGRLPRYSRRVGRGNQALRDSLRVAAGSEFRRIAVLLPVSARPLTFQLSRPGPSSRAPGFWAADSFEMHSPASRIPPRPSRTVKPYTLLKPGSYAVEKSSAPGGWGRCANLQVVRNRTARSFRTAPPQPPKRVPPPRCGTAVARVHGIIGERVKEYS